MCRHTQTSIVVATNRDHGEDFLTVQCDLCGMGLPDADIPAEVFDAWLDAGLRLPQVDLAAYKRALDVQWRMAVDGELSELRVLAEVLNG